eukprot:scaffold1_cov402-Prasinococcus_capsulatus_cf.AAC.46
MEDGQRHASLVVDELEEAEYMLRVYAIDEAGNKSKMAKCTWTAPRTVLYAGPELLSASYTAAFIIGASEEAPSAFTYEYRLDYSLEWSPGSATTVIGNGFEFIVEELQEGPHIIQVRSCDTSQNCEEEGIVYEWTVNVYPSDTILLSKPPEVTNKTEAEFLVNSSELKYSFSYSLNNGKRVYPMGQALVAGEQSFKVKGIEGINTVKIWTVDVAGMEDPTPEAYQWTIDTHPPLLTVLRAPEAVVTATDAYFGLSSNEAFAYTYRLAGTPDWQADIDVSFSEDSVVDAEEQAVGHGDPAGTSRISTAGYQRSTRRGWTIYRLLQTHRFSGGKARHRCTSPGGTVLTEECHRATDIDAPAHIQVKARDTAGNEVTYERMIQFSVDFGPPESTILEAPPKQTTFHQAEFKMGSSEPDCVFDYRVDDHSWQTSRSTTIRFNVKAGFHSFRVRARDATGRKEKTAKVYEWAPARCRLGLALPMLTGFLHGIYLTTQPVGDLAWQST